MVEFSFVVIEDEPDMMEQVTDYCNEVKKIMGLEGEIFPYETKDAFLEDMENISFDLLIADLKLAVGHDDRSGWEAIEEILSRTIPVVIYSGFANEKHDPKYNNILIKKVVKGSAENIIDIIKKMVQIKLNHSKTKKIIDAEFNKITLVTIGQLINDDQDFDDFSEDAIAYMAINRLTSFLMNNVPLDAECIPPESIFIYPPLQYQNVSEFSLFLGDILEETTGNGTKKYWMVISPSCDLVFGEGRQQKVKNVLLIKLYTNYSDVSYLRDINDHDERIHLIKDKMDKKIAQILKAPKNIFGTDHIYIDYKKYETKTYRTIRRAMQRDNWKKITSIATPYAESLQNKILADISRIGTPETESPENNGETWRTEFSR